MTIDSAGGTIHWLGTAPRLRIAHWPNGPRGTVLLLNGRTEFIEKYLEPIAELQARGFAVWTLDWRGQGASTRPLPDPHAHHVDSFEDYLADLDQVLETHVLPSLRQRPLILMAHSMGAHIAARMLARRPAPFARAILCAPMVDFLRGGPIPGWFARLLARAACQLPGRAHQYGPGGASHNPNPPFENNRLTSCPDRHAADTALVQANPELALGGVTWGWLQAAMASIALLRLPDIQRQIDMPVLVAMAGDDTIVDNRAIRAFAMALPRGKLVHIRGARHELLRERDEFRHPLWSAIDTFLEPVQ